MTTPSYARFAKVRRRRALFRAAAAAGALVAAAGIAGVATAEVDPVSSPGDVSSADDQGADLDDVVGSDEGEDPADETDDQGADAGDDQDEQGDADPEGSHAVGVMHRSDEGAEHARDDEALAATATRTQESEGAHALDDDADEAEDSGDDHAEADDDSDEPAEHDADHSEEAEDSGDDHAEAEDSDGEHGEADHGEDEHESDD